MEGIEAKIDRARECLQTLEADMAAFCEYQRRRTIFEIEQGWASIVGENIPKAPISYSIRVGEIAYNLRSALDHLVSQLVINNGRRPSYRTEFPIYRDRDQYEKAAETRLKGVSQLHKDLIQLLQPLHRDGAVGAHLWMLHSICNIDKHRHLNIVALHETAGAHLKEGTDPDLANRMGGGLALLNMLKGSQHEDKVSIDVVVDICFMDKELEEASPGYGTAIEGEGIKRPPVASVLWGCLFAVQFVVDRLTSELTTGKWAEVTR